MSKAVGDPFYNVSKAVGAPFYNVSKASGPPFTRAFIILVTVHEGEAPLVSSHLQGPRRAATMLLVSKVWRHHIHI